MEERERLVKLESDVAHIKNDVSEIKTEMGGMRKEIAAVKDSVAVLALQTEKSFAVFSEKMNESFKKVDESFAKLKIGRALDKVWWLLIAGAILGVMARGFKWI